MFTVILILYFSPSPLSNKSHLFYNAQCMSVKADVTLSMRRMQKIGGEGGGDVSSIRGGSNCVEAAVCYRLFQAIDFDLHR